MVGKVMVIIAHFSNQLINKSTSQLANSPTFLRINAHINKPTRATIPAFNKKISDTLMCVSARYPVQKLPMIIPSP
jgi:hypothetical protein